MWTAFMICVVVWLSFVPVNRHLLRTKHTLGRLEPDENKVLRYAFGTLGLMAFFGWFSIGLIKIIREINS